MELPKIISLLHRKMNTELNDRLSEIGLSNAKSRLLKHLHSEGEMTQTDLCTDLELDKSTVAKALSRMEEQGLISKYINPEDTRSFVVSITPKSSKIIPEAQKVSAEWSSDVTSVLTKEEKKLFYDFLNRVTQHSANISSREASND